MNAGQNNALYELASRMCDGNLLLAEIERLEDILRSDPTARRFYYDLIQLHGELDWAHGKLQTRSGANRFTLAAGNWSLEANGHPSRLPVTSADISPVLGYLGPAVNLVTRWLSSPKILALVVVGACSAIS